MHSRKEWNSNIVYYKNEPNSNNTHQNAAVFPKNRRWDGNPLKSSEGQARMCSCRQTQNCLQWF